MIEESIKFYESGFSASELPQDLDLFEEKSIEWSLSELPLTFQKAENIG